MPRDEVIELDMSVEDAIKMIISAWMVTPREELSGAERILAGRMSKSELERRLFDPDDARGPTGPTPRSFSSNSRCRAFAWFGRGIAALG